MIRRFNIVFVIGLIAVLFCISNIYAKTDKLPEYKMPSYKLNSFIALSKYTSDDYTENQWQILNFGIQSTINLSPLWNFGIQTGIFREVSGGSDFSIYDIPIVPFLELDVNILRFQFGFGYFFNIRNYYSEYHIYHNYGYFLGVIVPISITDDMDLLLILQRYYIVQEFDDLATIKFGAGIEYKIF